MRKILSLALVASLFFSCSSSNAKKVAAPSVTEADGKPAKVNIYRLEVVAEYPHDVNSYTQGLFFKDGHMYESTGQYGESTIRKVDLNTGKPVLCRNLEDKYFAEGSVVFDGDLYVLTWVEKTVFVYDAQTFECKAEKKYPREGWGLTTDGRNLIASDGTSNLYFMDKDFNLNRYVQVRFGDRPVQWLNELEYIDGKVWANVYTSDEIVIINPQTGYVEGVIDCQGLLPEKLHTAETDVLNGIAYDAHTGKIYLTGKNWPTLYEVRLVSAN